MSDDRYQVIGLEVHTFNTRYSVSRSNGSWRFRQTVTKLELGNEGIYLTGLENAIHANTHQVTDSEYHTPITDHRPIFPLQKLYGYPGIRKLSSTDKCLSMNFVTPQGIA